MSKHRKKKYGIYSLGRKEKKSIKKCNLEAKASAERDKEKSGGKQKRGGTAPFRAGLIFWKRSQLR